MSTVLQAVRVRDGLVTPASFEDAADGGWRPWARPALALGLALAAAIPAAVLLPLPGGRWQAERVASPPPPAAAPREVVEPVREAVPVPAAVAQVPVAPPALRAAPTTGEAPRARLGRWAPIVAPPAVALPDAGAMSAAPAPGVPAVATGGGAKAVRLQSVQYGASPAERTVTLAVDGGTPVSLRQGEAAGDVEVQLVLPGGAYVRRGGDVFVLGDVQ